MKLNGIVTMPLIIWNRSIEMDIKKIDDQHKKLVQIINDLYDARNEGKSGEVLEEIINRLIEYTEYHFTTEERYFKELNYSGSEEHKKEHDYFSQQVIQYRKSLEEGNNTEALTSDVWKLLQNWLVNHINNSDKKYKPLFTDKGIR